MRWSLGSPSGRAGSRRLTERAYSRRKEILLIKNNLYTIINPRAIACPVLLQLRLCHRSQGSLANRQVAATRSGRFICHRQRSHRSPTRDFWCQKSPKTQGACKYVTQSPLHPYAFCAEDDYMWIRPVGEDIILPRDDEGIVPYKFRRSASPPLRLPLCRGSCQPNG